MVRIHSKALQTYFYYTLLALNFAILGDSFSQGFISAIYMNRNWQTAYFPILHIYIVPPCLKSLPELTLFHNKDTK